MQIEIKQIRQNEDDQTVFFTLIDDQNDSYDWHADVPQDVDIQNHLETNIERYLLLIRKRQYPGTQYQSSPGETELAKFEEWINDGCMNRDEEGQYIEKIEKVPWKGTHPKSIKLDKDIDVIETIDDIKAILKELIK